MEALSPAKHDDPTQRDFEPFLHCMRYLTQPLNLTELTVCCKNSLQGQYISEDKSMKMMEMICRHIGKLSLHVQEPTWWGAVSAYFDTVLSRRWHYEMRGAGGREAYLVAHRDSLRPFLYEDVVKKANMCVKNNKTPDASDVRLLQATQVGKALYKIE